MIKEDFDTYSKMATSRQSTEDRNKEESQETNHTKSSRHHNSQIPRSLKKNFSQLNSRKFIEPTAPCYEVAMKTRDAICILNCKWTRKLITNHLTSTKTGRLLNHYVSVCTV
jgi:hypothetical protein